MKHLIAKILFISAAFAFPAISFAQVPTVLPVQGYLTDDQGEPVTGSVSATFGVWDSANGGNRLWNENLMFEADSGTFTALLGQSTALDDTVYTAADDLWVSITIDGEPLQPRLRIGTVPFAAVAGIADVASSLEGFTSSDFAKAGDVDWAELKNVPSNLDAFGALACASGQVAQADANGWTCANASGDTLAGMSCGTDEIAVWSGSAWLCGARDAAYATVATTGSFNDLANLPSGLLDGDNDTLAGLSCSSGEYVGWNGSDWVCVSSSVAFTSLQNIPAGLADGDDDTLAGLSCTAGQLAGWNGSSWACIPEPSADFADLTNIPPGLSDGDDDTLAGLGCSSGQFPSWNGTAWNCATVEADQDSLGALSCGTNEIAVWNGGSWACAPLPIDTDTDTLGALNCPALHIPVWSGALWLCAPLPADTDTLGDLSCSNGEVALYNGATWTCAVLPTTTIGGLSCSIGQIARYTSSGWACGPDTNTPPLTEAQVDAYANNNGYVSSTGDAAISGTVTADGFSFTNKQFSYLYLTPSQFTPWGGDDLQADFPIPHLTTNGYRYYNATAGTMNVQAPLGVPNGARVERIHCYVYDNDATENVEAFQVVWRQRELIATSIAARASISTPGTTGASPDVVPYASSTPNVLPIDYSTHDHMVDVTFRGSGPSTELRFYGCRVTYSTSTVLP